MVLLFECPLFRSQLYPPLAEQISKIKFTPKIRDLIRCHQHILFACYVLVLMLSALAKVLSLNGVVQKLRLIWMSYLTLRKQ